MKKDFLELQMRAISTANPNLNGSWFTKEALVDAIDECKNKPILGYFNSDGVPLQWKIIKYTVMMPMMYQVEFLIDDEWVINDYNYCLLTTIQGTCRAWLENNTAYYEHWGTGEKVTWDEFWSQFFTKEELVQAYQNRLYPDR